MTKASSTVLVFLILVVAIVAVHGPGLAAAPQWDVMHYLLERQAWPTFNEAIQRLDYSLARRFWKGDEGQYRPLLLLLVAAEYEAFGFDIRGWHAVNIGLHIAVVLLLYRLFSQTLPRDLAFAVSLLFSVMHATVGLVQVAWVGGYMAGCALLLAALHVAWAQLREGNATAVTPWLPYAIGMTLAAFVFEVFVVYAFLLAVCFWVWLRRRGLKPSASLAALWLLPVLVFSSLYVPRIFIAPRLLYVDDLPSSHLLAQAHLTNYVRRVAEYFLRWGTTTAMPTIRPLFMAFFDERVPAGPLRILAMAVNTGALMVIAGLVWKHSRHAWSLDARSKLATLTVLLVGYVALVRFGREHTDETHRYLFALIAVLMLGTMLEVSKMADRARRVVIGALVMLAAINAELSEDLTSRSGREGADYVRYLSSIHRFVQAHRSEPAFSFHLDADPEFLQPVDLLEGYPDQPTNITRKYLWETFPGAVSNPAEAAHLLRWDGKQMVVSRSIR